MKRILFVDPEPQTLQGLEELLDPHHVEWEISVVGSVALALERLDREVYDVVVADSHIPGTDGSTFLARVRQEQPTILRLLAVDPADRETLNRVSSEAHGTLAKPCSTNVLRTMLSRGCALQEILTSQRIRRLVAGLEMLPSAPSVYFDFLEAMRRPETSVEDLGDVIARDIGLTAKVLQIVNSAMFGLKERIVSTGHAVTFLGIETLKSLILSVQTYSQFEEDKVKGVSLTQVWEHSMRVASFARAIARAERSTTKDQDAAFLAGMMHDCGKLVMAVNRPERFKAAIVFAERENGDSVEYEQRLFGASHGALGAFVLNNWSLPMSVVEAVALHHTPSQSVDLSFSPLCAVHVANCIVHIDLDRDDEPEIPGLDLEYLSRLGLERRLPRWMQVCREAMRSEIS